MTIISAAATRRADVTQITDLLALLVSLHEPAGAAVDERHRVAAARRNHASSLACRPTNKQTSLRLHRQRATLEYPSHRQQFSFETVIINALVDQRVDTCH